MKENNTSFIKQAAKASWIVPLMNLCFMAIGNSAIKTTNVPFLSLIIGGIAIFLFIAGIICAIIGLLGIKKEGTKSILVPSILGLMLNGSFLFILLVAAISSFNRCR
ncbi:MAG: hypothetical protein ABH865_04940 [Candidatus Omnitrophota bacterium]|nr:hypothetical protein [Candidatus Omnitrophota bacterium]